MQPLTLSKLKQHLLRALAAKGPPQAPKPRLRAVVAFRLPLCLAGINQAKMEARRDWLRKVTTHFRVGQEEWIQEDILGLSDAHATRRVACDFRHFCRCASQSH